MFTWIKNLFGGGSNKTVSELVVNSNNQSYDYAYNTGCTGSTGCTDYTETVESTGPTSTTGAVEPTVPVTTDTYLTVGDIAPQPVIEPSVAQAPVAPVKEKTKKVAKKVKATEVPKKTTKKSPKGFNAIAVGKKKK